MANLPKIVVALDLDTMDQNELCITAKGVITTGDPDVTTPPVTDAVLYAQADDLLKNLAKRKTDRSKDLTNIGLDLAGKVRMALQKDGLYVQSVANDVAEANGSVALGNAVVNRCGFKLKKKADKTPRDFKVVGSGPGWTHLRVKAVGKRAGYLWRFGKTTKKGIMPAGTLTTLFTLECEIIINNQDSGDIYGYQMASILPVSHGSGTGTSPTITAESASMMPASKTKKATISSDKDPYNWSDYIYDICK